MTRIKSLFFGSRQDLDGHGHRIHRSKKGRNPPKEKYNKKLVYKKKLERIKISELEQYDYSEAG